MNADEFSRIAEVASSHWWYRTLHAEVLRALPTTPAALLDIGAGAGATLDFLKHARPDLSLHGIEPNAVGRDVAARHGVLLDEGSFDDFGKHEGHTFDAVLTLDNLYYLRTDERISAVADRIARHLTPGGTWIGQVAAFESLAGKHDAWVDCHRRFRGDELVSLFAPAGFDVTFRYRYQTLAPLVFFARRILSPLMREPERSDVTLPSPLVNRALEKLVTLEDAALRGASGRVYGSSVFWVARRR